MKSVYFVSLFFIVVFGQTQQAATKQCTSGACCDVSTKTIRPAGSSCSPSRHACLAPAAPCDGLSPKCAYVFRPNGTPCREGGNCNNGICHKDGKAIEFPNKSFGVAAMRTIVAATEQQNKTATQEQQPVAVPKEEPKKEEKKEEVIAAPILVHHYDDPILDTLRQLPELAKLRYKKHQVEDKKVKAFRKLTHLVLRKHTEQLENNQMFVRHGKTRLQDEAQDVTNVHRHLHLHHKQNHGLDKTATEQVADLSASLLKAGNDNGPSSLTIFFIIMLAAVAMILVIVIVVNATKAVKAKPAKKDYY